MNRTVSILFASIAAVASAACSSAEAQLEQYPDTLEGFEEMSNTLVTAVRDGNQSRVERIAKSWKLAQPKPFFEKTFGPELAPALAAEHTDTVGGFEKDVFKGLTKIIVGDGKTKARVSRHTDPDDETARGYQVRALKKMKTPVALYTLRLTTPEKESGFSLWSFAYVDGGFRLIGKMKQVDPREPGGKYSTELDMLDELPMVEARQILDDGAAGK
jgi:hypothetical protein